jgi:radical S-adenosyl methionine domain-containing protein 2
MNEITINWHILEKCNYSCDYCFAKYAKNDEKEIHNSKEKITLLLNKVYNYFVTRYNGYSIRLNIAGGEPMLSKNLNYIIETAFNIGFKISLITNASKLTSKFVELNAKYISMFAISIDSISDTTNLNIGRSSRTHILSISKIFKHLEQLKLLNPDLKIKINTVVNQHNHKDYLGDLIDLIKPYKWKVLQALSLDKDKIFCSDEQFHEFLNNHNNIVTAISKESNDDMTDSYIMLDPHGRFYQNTFGNYIYSEPILSTDISDAFKSIQFDLEKFKERYRNDI